METVVFSEICNAIMFTEETRKVKAIGLDVFFSYVLPIGGLSAGPFAAIRHCFATSGHVRITILTCYNPHQHQDPYRPLPICHTMVLSKHHSRTLHSHSSPNHFIYSHPIQTSYHILSDCTILYTHAPGPTQISTSPLVLSHPLSSKPLLIPYPTYSYPTYWISCA